MTNLVYCDPNKAFIGAKWQETRKLDVTEIAKKLRSDIKAGVKNGALPMELKVTIRISRSNYGGRITVEITKLPDVWCIETKKFRDWKKENPFRSPFENPFYFSGLSDEHRELIKKLEEMGGAYNMKDGEYAHFYLNVLVARKEEERIKGL